MSGLIRPCQEIYPSPLILNLARVRGIPISFGSDAHGPQDVGRYFDQALKLAKEAGYTHCLRMRGRKKELVPLPGGGEEGGSAWVCGCVRETLPQSAAIGCFRRESMEIEEE